MNVPAFDHIKITDLDGTYSQEAQHYNDVLNQQLQENLSNDGYVIPPRTLEEIQSIINPSNSNPKGPGTVWYDVTNNKLIVNIAGVLHEINTTEITT